MINRTKILVEEPEEKEILKELEIDSTIIIKHNFSIDIYYT
jgi:hypothetical protein